MSNEQIYHAELRRGVTVGIDSLFDLIIMALHPIFERAISPRSARIGVFGPYIENGHDVIRNIMKHLASRGFCGVTGIYYLRPSDDEPRRISGIMPPVVRDLINKLVPTHRWLHEFPRLVAKSVVYLTHLRGQGNEVEGCSDFGIPMLGFILTDEIKRERNVCNYLIDRENYTECICPDAELCNRVVEAFCPFYDSVHVPWSIKKLFLNSDRLIAAKNIDDLKPVIDEFIGLP